MGVSRNESVRPSQLSQVREKMDKDGERVGEDVWPEQHIYQLDGPLKPLPCFFWNNTHIIYR